ncbi:MAG: PQQ-dependent sugar dehydrogenase, partial [Bacteroidota bacterium]
MRKMITARRIPGTMKMAFADVFGEIYSWDFSDPNPSKVLLGDIDPSGTYTNNRFGLKGIAFHPEFGQSGSPNREYIYVSYVHHDTKRRISRFNISASTGLLDNSSELVMIELVTPGGSYHSVGELEFGTDGFLYIPFGDGHGGNFGPLAGTTISDTIMNNVQRIDNNLSGGILRIDVDMDPSKSHAPRKTLPQAFPGEVSGVGYWIPNDNPWLDINGSIMEEYYSLGHRNPWKMTIDPLTGDVWDAEVGPANGEELNKVDKGHNYGWPYRVGPTGVIAWDRSPPSAPQPNPFLGVLTEPMLSPDRADATSMLVGCVYRGSLHPSLYGKAICADLSKKYIWAVGGDNTSGRTSLDTLAPMQGNAWTIFEGPDEEIYMLATGGNLFKLEGSTGGSSSLPTTLSATGAFSNLTNMTPSQGFIPYTVNTALWSDRADKFRWIAIPNDGTHDTPSEKVTFSNEDYWEFPEGTVIVKHFELALDENNPSVTTKVETRFIVIGSGGSVYGITYKWRADQSDADLLPAGDTENYTITATGGGTYTQTWEFPDRTQCLNCHNENAGDVLGINTRQLNGEFTYPSTGATDNQLNTWNHLNIFDVSLGDSKDYLRNVPLDDLRATNQFKVRSYLDANCSYCHQPGGVAAAFDARIATSIHSQGLILEPVISAVSKKTHIVEPGDAANSELWVRDNSISTDAMPPLAKSIVHDEYMQVLTDWINGLEPTQTDTLGEVGNTQITHSWQTLNFQRSYTSPIIVAGASSYNENEPANVRIRNLTSNSCEIRLDEWECDDETHLQETVGYLIIEAGVHVLPNGQKLIADQISANQDFATYTFPVSLASTPAILGQVVTEFEANAVVTRFDHTQLSNAGFRMKLQEEEGSDGIHANETVCFIVAEEGNYDGYLPLEVKRLTSLVDDNWTYLEFEQDYENDPVFLSQISSNRDSDVCGLRFRNLYGGDAELLVEEEQCSDAETTHAAEDVSYFAFAESGLIVGDIETTNLPIELISFTASQEVDGVLVEWTTATEIDNDYFVLEKSLDGILFQPVTTVDGKGNSQSLQHYAYKDGILKSPALYYRLKQVDFDGQFSVSNIISVYASGKLSPED